VKDYNEVAGFAYATALNTVLVIASVVCLLTGHPFFAVLLLFCGVSTKDVRGVSRYDDERG